MTRRLSFYHHDPWYKYHQGFPDRGGLFGKRNQTRDVTDPIFILFVLGVNIVSAELLARHTLARHLGATLLVMVLTAVVANLGVIPTSADDAPIYDSILTYVTPLAIFWLLLRVNLRDVLKAGLPMIGLFLVGSVGTAVGVLVAMWAVDGSKTIGESYRAIGGIFVGTYTGGGVNFNALALHYGVNKQGPVFAGIVAVDNILTTVWMAATIILPRVLVRAWPQPRRWPKQLEPSDSDSATAIQPPEGKASRPVIDHTDHDESERVDAFDLGVLLALGAVSVWVSECAANWLDEALGITLPSIVILTTIALVLAQLRIVQRQRGSQVLGLFAMYLFLAVIAASCDVRAFGAIGRLGVTLFIFASLVIFIHAVVTFGTAALFRIDVDVAAIASQANIGGATTALGVAKSLGRRDLALPAVLVGSLGYAVGTYLGFAVAEYVL